MKSALVVRLGCGMAAIVAMYAVIGIFGPWFGLELGLTPSAVIRNKLRTVFHRSHQGFLNRGWDFIRISSAFKVVAATDRQAVVEFLVPELPASPCSWLKEVSAFHTLDDKFKVLEKHILNFHLQKKHSFVWKTDIPSKFDVLAKKIYMRQVVDKYRVGEAIDLYQLQENWSAMADGPLVFSMLIAALIAAFYFGVERNWKVSLLVSTGICLYCYVLYLMPGAARIPIRM